MNATELKDALSNFTGTEAYHRINPLTPNVLGTDGSVFLAEHGHMWWLLDVVGSHMPSVPKDETFVVALLKVDGSSAVFTLQDDIPANTVYARQEIGFTDCMFEEVKLYVARQGRDWIVMLPGEY